MKKHERPEPEYLQALKIDRWLTEEEKHSLIEFIAIKHNEEPFIFEGKQYVEYTSYCLWADYYYKN